MKIAICDDEKILAELFRQKILAEESESEIFVFTRGDDLIQSATIFDAAFLDIEMEEMDGFRVAELLKVKQPQCVFSFITTHVELAVDGYDYQPFRYILKTAPEVVIKRKIRETLNEAYNKNKVLQISYKGNYHNVLVGDIFYIEIVGHCMKIALENTEIYWNKQLVEIEKEMNKYRLVRCHRSFMVAKSKIKEIISNAIRMKNGYTVPIGRKYKKQFFEEYNKFIFID